MLVMLVVWDDFLLRQDTALCACKVAYFVGLCHCLCVLWFFSWVLFHLFILLFMYLFIVYFLRLLIYTQHVFVFVFVFFIYCVGMLLAVCWDTWGPCVQGGAPGCGMLVPGWFVMVVVVVAPDDKPRYTHFHDPNRGQ